MLLKFEESAEPGVITIADGYKWCMECEYLTPHESDGGDASCVICGNTKYDYGECPNCGWEHDADELQHGFIIVKHHLGCHMRDVDRNMFDYEEIPHIVRITRGFIRNNETVRLPRNTWYSGDYDGLPTCGCPEVIVYKNLHISDFKQWAGPGFNCYNETEWSYTVRCPICFATWEEHDGNC